MPKVPQIPKKEFGKWIPDKQEIHSMRYWRAKKPPKPPKQD